MAIVRLILREIVHRKLNFVLGLTAVVAAVGLVVAMLTMGRASERETRRLMRDMGFNLLIVPRDTNMHDFWASDFADKDMPEDYVRRLAGSREIDADHFVATLEQRVRWRGRPVLLTGLLPELGRIGQRKKAPMGFRIEPGTCLVGFELASALTLKRKQTIEVLGRKLTVVDCLAESGSKDDIRLFANLHDVQAMLGKPGRVNMIQALGCLCEGHRLGEIRRQLENVLPEAKVSELRTIAMTRAEMRQVVERHVAFITAAVLCVCAAWVGLLAWLNVRERYQEIGVLRALGFGSVRIAALFLGKAVALGLLGAVVGFFVGNELAMRFGPDMFKMTAKAIRPSGELLAWSALAAPVLTALASFLPAMAAVARDPAVSLTED